MGRPKGLVRLRDCADTRACVSDYTAVREHRECNGRAVRDNNRWSGHTAAEDRAREEAARRRRDPWKTVGTFGGDEGVQSTEPEVPGAYSDLQLLSQFS